MSSQSQQGRRQRSRGSRSQGQRSSNQFKGRDRQSPSKNKSQKSSINFLTKLEKEYNPPFVLGATWEPKESEYYQVKLPHPFFEDQKETVRFPMFSSGTKISERSLFYSSVLDLQEQVNFYGENGPLLYYTLGTCLKGDPLMEWKDIVSVRENNAARTPENFAIDVDEFITLHESRDPEDLLQDQELNYFMKLRKPQSMSPTKFKTQLESLNKRIFAMPLLT